MKQRTAILIAAVVTAFLLVTAGGILARVTLATNSADPVAEAATASPAAQLTATLDPQVEALIQAREAQYQEQLAAANARLQEAYAQQQAIASQLAQAQAVSQPQAAAAQAAAPTTGYAISPEQAVSVALSAAPGNTAQTAPQLVSFQGIAAYEVALSGGLVYVDANSGAILYNAATAPAVAAPQFNGSDDDDDHEGHEEREHEEGDDD